ncbi:uncharacterized protein LOC144446660 [Glandiceps talaboti]
MTRSLYFVRCNLVFLCMYLAQIGGTLITVDPPGPIVAAVGTNLTIHFRLYDDGNPFLLSTHVDHSYFDFPPGFRLEFDQGGQIGSVIITTNIGPNETSTADVELAYVTEDFSGRYGVQIQRDEDGFGGPSRYVEVIVPAAEWKPKGFIVARVGQTISMECMAVEYASLEASTSFNSDELTISADRQRRSPSDNGPNPVVTLNATIESVTEADMGRYACTSRDRNNPKIETTEYLELLIMSVMTTGSKIIVEEGQHTAIACWIPWLDESLQTVEWFRDYSDLSRIRDHNNEIDLDNDGIPDAMTSLSGRWLIFFRVNMALTGNYQCKVKFTIPQQGRTIYSTPWETISLKVTLRETSESVEPPPCESWQDFDLSSSKPDNLVAITERDRDFRWTMQFRVRATNQLNITVSDASWVDDNNRFIVLMGVRNDFGNSFTLVERHGIRDYNDDEHRKYEITPNILSDDPNIWDEFTLQYYYDTLRILRGDAKLSILTYNNFQQFPTFTRFFADFSTAQMNNDTQVQVCVIEDVVDPTPVICETESCTDEVSAGVFNHADVMVVGLSTFAVVIFSSFTRRS